MKWVLVTWILNSHGAPVYQHLKNQESEARCEATYKELVKAPGNKIAGHICTPQSVNDK